MDYYHEDGNHSLRGRIRAGELIPWETRDMGELVHDGFGADSRPWGLYVYKDRFRLMGEPEERDPWPTEPDEFPLTETEIQQYISNEPDWIAQSKLRRVIDRQNELDYDNMNPWISLREDLDRHAREGPATPLRASIRAWRQEEARKTVKTWPPQPPPGPPPPHFPKGFHAPPRYALNTSASTTAADYSQIQSTSRASG